MIIILAWGIYILNRSQKRKRLGFFTLGIYVRYRIPFHPDHLFLAVFRNFAVDVVTGSQRHITVSVFFFTSLQTRFIFPPPEVSDDEKIYLIFSPRLWAAPSGPVNSHKFVEKDNLRFRYNSSECCNALCVILNYDKISATCSVSIFTSEKSIGIALNQSFPFDKMLIENLNDFKKALSLRDGEGLAYDVIVHPQKTMIFQPYLYPLGISALNCGLFLSWFYPYNGFGLFVAPITNSD